MRVERRIKHYLQQLNDVSYQQHKTPHQLQLTSSTYLLDLHPTENNR